MTTENDGILNGATELNEGLDGQGGGSEDLLRSDTLLPPPEPEGSNPPPADDAQGDGPPIPEEDGVPGAAEDVSKEIDLPVEGAAGEGLAPGEPAEEEGSDAASAEEKPKRKRTATRKKAAPKAEDLPADETPAAETPTGDGGTEELGRQEAEDDGLGPVGEETPALSSGDTPAVVAAPRSVAAKPGAPVVRRRALAGLDLRELDRGLSKEQQQEWNDIYASYRSKTVLSGHIMGVDRDEFKVKNRETGVEELQRMHTVIVIP